MLNQTVQDYLEVSPKRLPSIAIAWGAHCYVGENLRIPEEEKLERRTVLWLWALSNGSSVRGPIPEQQLPTEGRIWFTVWMTQM